MACAASCPFRPLSQKFYGRLGPSDTCLSKLDLTASLFRSRPWCWALRQQLQRSSIINYVIVSQYDCSWTMQRTDENFRLKHMSQQVPTLQVSDAGAESDLRLTMTSPQPEELVKAQLSMKQHFLRSCTMDQGYKAARHPGFCSCGRRTSCPAGRRDSPELGPRAKFTRPCVSAKLLPGPCSQAV